MLPESVPHCCGWKSNICWPMITKSAGCGISLLTSYSHQCPVFTTSGCPRGGSFTSLGFSPCLLSILYTVLCDICIVWAMCDTVAHAAFIPMTCHRWLMVLFPNWPVTKSWLLGWPKLCWFHLYFSKTIGSISLIFVRHVPRYIHVILTIFQEATQCLTLWKISLKNFCKNFFPGVY